jgi:uncharacterized protein (DUF983 family)
MSTQGQQATKAEHVDDADDYPIGDIYKSKVECICPKCGKRHVMNFHWIGRGTPRKFCSSCRESE